MQYYSTRDINLNKTFEEIIIQSLCRSGGLYLPMDYPTLNYEEIFKNKELTGYDKIRIYGFLAERYMPYWFKKNFKTLN